MSNRLPILAAEIRQAHADVQAAVMAAAKKAIDAGSALIEAKEAVAHGEWLRFLAEIGIPERTAQRYMQLAQSGLPSDTVSDLGGPTPALRFLKLRAKAVAAFDEAEAEARAGGDGLEPIERACDLLNEMVEMFASVDGKAGDHA